MLKKIKDRVHQWKTDNNVDNTEMAIMALYGTVLAGITAATIAAIVQANNEAKENREWIKQEVADGRQVYALADGTLISTEQATIKW
jgi:gas vesicle protein